jgi:hypothetical protein
MRVLENKRHRDRGDRFRHSSVYGRCLADCLPQQGGRCQASRAIRRRNIHGTEPPRRRPDVPNGEACFATTSHRILDKLVAGTDVIDSYRVCCQRLVRVCQQFVSNAHVAHRSASTVTPVTYAATIAVDAGRTQPRSAVNCSRTAHRFQAHYACAFLSLKTIPC